LSEVFSVVFNHVKVGARMKDLDNLAEEEIVKRGAFPSFKKVKGYHWTICVCANEEVVHGVPDDYVIRSKDVISIDCGVYYKGFHTDASWTMQVGEFSDAVTEFLKSGKTTLEKALKQVRLDNYIYDISKTIQDEIHSAGYTIVHSLVGHGVGRKLHEDPEIPGIIRSKRLDTSRIVKGMVLAVEVIYTMGKPEISYDTNDKWTLVTKDGKISGLFEATVAVTSHGCLILTPIFNLELSKA